MIRGRSRVLGRVFGAVAVLSLAAPVLVGWAGTGSVSARASAARDSRAEMVRPGHAARASVAAVIAVALRGDIYTVPVSGGSPRRLTTTGGLNSSPALSPHGSLIAYLSAPRQYVNTSGFAKTHNVWITPVDGNPDGSDAYRIAGANPAIDRGGISWSPDGQHLAYYEGADIVVDDYQGKHRAVVLHTGRSFRVAGVDPLSSGAIAWSPDSRRVAVGLPPTNAGPPPADELRVAIADITSIDDGKTNVVTVRFPSGALTGSSPSGQGLVWASDGRHFLVETLANGSGPLLTGIWRVSSSGGLATLLAGSAPGGRQGKNTGAPFAGATHVVLSPDRAHLATDTAGGLWIADTDGSHGHRLDLGVARGCVLAQFAWRGNSAGLAYVTLCMSQTPSTSTNKIAPITYHATLSTVLAGGGSSRTLLRADGKIQTVLDLAPAYGCLVCG